MWNSFEQPIYKDYFGLKLVVIPRQQRNNVFEFIRNYVSEHMSVQDQVEEENEGSNLDDEFAQLLEGYHGKDKENVSRAELRNIGYFVRHWSWSKGYYLGMHFVHEGEERLSALEVLREYASWEEEPEGLEEQDMIHPN